MKFLLFILLIQAFILSMNFVNAAIKNDKDDGDMLSSMVKFCLGKERKNFCSNQNLHMMVNIAAQQGKSRPLKDTHDLELERQKAIEKQRIFNMEREKNRIRLLELKKEQQRQNEIMIKRKQEEERLKTIEEEERIIKHILKSFSQDKRVGIFFRF